MNKRVTALIEEARNLTADEREELILRLQHEFSEQDSDGTPEELQAAWVEECGRRMDAYHRGETTMTRAIDVHESIDERLSRLWK